MGGLDSAHKLWSRITSRLSSSFSGVEVLLAFTVSLSFLSSQYLLPCTTFLLSLAINFRSFFALEDRREAFSQNAITFLNLESSCFNFRSFFLWAGIDCLLLTEISFGLALSESMFQTSSPIDSLETMDRES